MFLDDSTKARLLRLTPSQRTDGALYYMLAPHLLGFWTFLKPGHSGRELGDVIFAFGDVCIIFEAKTRDKVGPTNEKWIRAKLKEAVSQINNNYEALASGSVPTIRNAWRGEVAWTSLGIKYYHGIVVMMHDSNPYDPTEMEPALFASAKIPTHVLSLHDISELVRFMNTPWDFIVYWELRRMIGKTHQLPVHKEQAIYWTILKNWVDLARAQGSKVEQAKLEDDRQFLEEYTHTVLRTGAVNDETKSKISASYLIDIAAGSLMQKAEQDETGKRVGDKDHELLVRTVEVLADLSRRRRAEYGLLWSNCARQGIVKQDNVWGNGYSPSRNRSYLFNARPRLEYDEESLKVKAAAKLANDKSSLVIGLSATSANILETHEQLFATAKGEKREENSTKILNTTSIILERT